MQTVLRKLARNKTVQSFKRLDEILPLLARLSESSDAIGFHDDPSLICCFYVGFLWLMHKLT